MIEDKYTELVSYLKSLAIRSSVYESHQDDVIQNALERLLEEELVKPFDTPRDLWGRATNVMKEEIHKSFAASLPVSGVGRQAHHYARKYLAQNNYDPHQAYANQSETPRIGLALLKLVSGGTGQTDPHLLSNLSFDGQAFESSLSESVEVLVRNAVGSLPPDQRVVVELHLGFIGDPKPLSQVAEDLGVELSRVRASWRAAKRNLKSSLNVVWD